MDKLEEYGVLMKELETAESGLIAAGNADKERRAEETKSIIIGADKELIVVGINALRPAHEGIEHIASVLGSGGNVNFMTLDPWSDTFAKREAYENTTFGRLQKEWEAAVADLADAYSRAGSKGDLLLSLHEMWPLLSITARDTDTNDGRLQLNLYPTLEGTRGLRGTTFQLSATGDAPSEQIIYSACVDVLGAISAASEQYGPDRFLDLLDGSYNLWRSRYITEQQ
jgi:hypothetical protein